MVIVTGEMIINDPSKRDEFIAAMDAFNTMNRSMNGCIIHDCYSNVWEPNRIRLYIEYESAEALRALESSPEFIEANKNSLGALMDSGAVTMNWDGLRRNELGSELWAFGSA
jgi:quinol monooxygenase YgiN